MTLPDFSDVSLSFQLTLRLCFPFHIRGYTTLTTVSSGSENGPNSIMSDSIIIFSDNTKMNLKGSGSMEDSKYAECPLIDDKITPDGLPPCAFEWDDD